MKKNLVLTGMMGVGKSTVGRFLSKKLKMRFIDLDSVIEKKTSMKIKDIFKKKGEKYFRNLERRIGIEILRKRNSIIALGGGAFIDTHIRKIVLRNCISFWLDLKVEDVIIRSKNLRKRPLLNKSNLKDTYNNIYEKRKKVYNLADFKIDCSKITKTDLSEKIINIYENKITKN